MRGKSNAHDNSRYAKEWEKPTLTEQPELYQRGENYRKRAGGVNPQMGGAGLPSKRVEEGVVVGAEPAEGMGGGAAIGPGEGFGGDMAIGPGHVGPVLVAEMD